MALVRSQKATTTGVVRVFRSGRGDRRSATESNRAIGASAGDELVRRAHLGDGAAMAALYTRHVQAVHAYLVLQETVDAARIVGDAFAAAFASVRSVDGGDRGFRIHVLSHAHELLILEATREPNGGVPPAVLPAVVRRWLRALVPAQRDVIALQVASGLAASEAALVLRLSEPMVEIAQSRALRRLEYAGTGVVSALPLPPNLAVVVARDGGEGAITALVAAAETIPPVIPAAALRARFASVRADAPAPAASRGSRVKVVAVVGTTIGKIALGAGIAAATAGGAHVAGVVDLPLLPPVTRVSSTQEINENPTPLTVPSEVPPGSPQGEGGSDEPRDPGDGDGGSSTVAPSPTVQPSDIPADDGGSPDPSEPVGPLDDEDHVEDPADPENSEGGDEVDVPDEPGDGDEAEDADEAGGADERGDAGEPEEGDQGEDGDAGEGEGEDDREGADDAERPGRSGRDPERAPGSEPGEQRVDADDRGRAEGRNDDGDDGDGDGDDDDGDGGAAGGDAPADGERPGSPGSSGQRDADRSGDRGDPAVPAEPATPGVPGVPAAPAVPAVPAAPEAVPAVASAEPATAGERAVAGDRAGAARATADTPRVAVQDKPAGRSRPRTVDMVHHAPLVSGSKVR